jgi:molybdate transport system substrate-binding protein
LAKIALGEADAGFVYVSDVVAVGEESVSAIPLPIAPQKRPTYPIAVLKGTSAVESADAFVAFVLADEGQQILQKWGFGEPTGAPESELTP